MGARDTIHSRFELRLRDDSHNAVYNCKTDGMFLSIVSSGLFFPFQFAALHEYNFLS